MDRIAVGTCAPPTEVRQRLTQAFGTLPAAGVRVEIEEQNRGTWTFLGCRFDGARPDTSDITRRVVAAALCDFITGGLQERLLQKLLSSRYSYFNDSEQAGILATANRQLEQGRQGRPQSRGRILTRLQEYLSSHNTVLVDGFVTFRCRDYVEEVESALDEAVDTFLLEREYQEFIRLLRHFADCQPPRYEAVHVVLDRAGAGFALADADGGPLRSDAVGELAAELAAHDVAVEDLLLSALIALAPRTVVLHGRDAEPAPEVVAALQAVFGERVQLCPGCGRCRPEAGRAED